MNTYRKMMMLALMLTGMGATISFAQVATPPISGAAPGSQRPAPQDTLETAESPTTRGAEAPQMTAPVTAPGEAIPQRSPSAEPGPSLGSPPAEPGHGLLPETPPSSSRDNASKSGHR
jgi:hypothetical protein